jgi:hypothetical protein
MKTIAILEERPRHPSGSEPDHPPHARPLHRRGKGAEWRDLDEDRDTAWQDLLARIARGGRIRGHLL